MKYFAKTLKQAYAYKQQIEDAGYQCTIKEVPPKKPTAREIELGIEPVGGYTVEAKKQEISFSSLYDIKKRKGRPVSQMWS